MQKLTQRQNQFYQKLLRQVCPLGRENWFEKADVTLDFLQVLLEVRLDLPNDNWTKRLVAQVREAITDMEPRFLSKLVLGARKRIPRGEITINSLILLLTVAPTNWAGAAKIWDLIIKSAAQPEIKTVGTPASFEIVIILLAAQDDCHTWEALLEGVKRGQREPLRVFRKLLTLLSVISIYPRFVNFQSSSLKLTDENVPEKVTKLPDARFADRVKILWSEFNKRIDPRSIDNHLIPVPQQYIHCCNSTNERFCSSDLHERVGILKLITDFEANEEEYQAAAQKMWREIHTDTEYGLHRDGDTVLLGVQALRDHGYVSLDLFPGISFYDATARFWMHIRNLDLNLPIEYTLKPHQPLAPVSARPGTFNAVVEKFHQFVALQCFWMIVTGRSREKSAKSGNDRSGSNGSGQSRRGPCPHFPRLPQGQNPSKYAKDRCKNEFGDKQIPEGRTFAAALPEDQKKPASRDSKPASTNYPTFRYLAIQTKV